jgi:hypothetical protein
LANSQMQLAQVTFEQKNPVEAEGLARDAAAAFNKQKVVAEGCRVEALLSRALLAQDKLRDAQAAADRAMNLCRQGSDRVARFESLLASAAVSTQAGKYRDALKMLGAVRSEAKRFGYVDYDFEARLQIGQLELRSGKAATGGAHLAQLQSDARSRNYALIARKASLIH